MPVYCLSRPTVGSGHIKTMNQTLPQASGAAERSRETLNSKVVTFFRVRQCRCLPTGNLLKNKARFSVSFSQAVIQMMAAARAGRGLAFFTFMDENLKEEMETIHQLLLTERVTVGEMFYSYLACFNSPQL